MGNPVCLVSGSSSGIGTAIVGAFAARGYDVVVHYNSGSDASDRSEGSSSGGGGHTPQAVAFVGLTFRFFSTASSAALSCCSAANASSLAEKLISAAAT